MSIIIDVFPKLLKGGTHMPIYKYLNCANLINDDGEIDSNGLYESINTKIENGIEKIRSNANEAKRAGSIPQINEGVEQLYQAVEFSLFLRMAVFIQPDIIDLTAFEKILKKHADDKFSASDKSLFIKIVCFYDFIKHAKRIIRIQ